MPSNNPFMFSLGCFTPNPCFDDKTKTPCKKHTGTCRETCSLWEQYEKQHVKDTKAQRRQKFLDTIGNDSADYVKRQNGGRRYGKKR